VLNTQGLEQERLWLKYHVLEPRFANPNSIMPNMGLTIAEAESIADYLTSQATPQPTWKQTIKRYLPEPNYTNLLLAGAAGFLAAIPLVFIRRRKTGLAPWWK
jgi:hypothetical protein